MSWCRRAAHGVSYRHYRDQVTAAKARGDHQAVAEWTDRFDAARTARQARILSWPAEVARCAVLAVAAVAACGLLLLAGGVGAWLLPGGLSWASWWATVATGASWAGEAGKVAVWAALGGAAPLVLALAHAEGRRRATAPPWLLTATEKAQVNAEVTPSKVVTAFADLGISDLEKAIRAMPDGAAEMLSPIRVAGPGLEVDVRLPTRVDTGQVQARRSTLAGNLDRHRHEVFVEAAPTPRTVRLWIGDRGALDTPAPPSPLVTVPGLRADFRAGRAPWGVDLRARPVALSLHQCHLLCVGLSNQGKTAALRALALWAALDPGVVLWIADLKGAGDWAMFDDLAERMVVGPTDEDAVAATEMLEAAVAEMHRRLLAGGVHPPLVVIVDEAQVAYMCPVKDDQRRPYGGQSNDARYLSAVRKIHNQGRVVDVTLWEATQDPTNQNLPVLSRNGNHIRASLVVGTAAQAKMGLGEAAVAAGAAPHELRRGADRGTLIAAGDGLDLPGEQVTETIRTHYIDAATAAAITRRAVAARHRRPRTDGPPVAGVGAAPRDDLARSQPR